MESKLRFQFDTYEDDCNLLHLWFESVTCSGYGACWTDSESLLEMAVDFSAYPISPEKPPILSLGYASLDGSETVELIYMSAIQIDGRGTIGLRVSVRSDDRFLEPNYRASALLRATYADLERISQGLMALSRKQATEFELTLNG